MKRILIQHQLASSSLEYQCGTVCASDAPNCTQQRQTVVSCTKPPPNTIYPTIYAELPKQWRTAADNGQQTQTTINFCKAADTVIRSAMQLFLPYGTCMRFTGVFIVMTVYILNQLRQCNGRSSTKNGYHHR